MLKLKDIDIQPAMLGLPSFRREWWDIGNGYEIYVSIGEKSCGLGIDAPGKKDITLEVAKHLNIDNSLENMSFKPMGRELYLSPSIDCVMLNYTKPENYKELLQKIEVIVEKYFKNQ
jgi:hypothetical protein